jgi:hypothetical protein
LRDRDVGTQRNHEDSNRFAKLANYEEISRTMVTHTGKGLGRLAAVVQDTTEDVKLGQLNRCKRLTRMSLASSQWE